MKPQLALLPLLAALTLPAQQPAAPPDFSRALAVPAAGAYRVPLDARVIAHAGEAGRWRVIDPAGRAVPAWIVQAAPASSAALPDVATPLALEPLPPLLNITRLRLEPPARNLNFSALEVRLAGAFAGTARLLGPEGGRWQPLPTGPQAVTASGGAAPPQEGGSLLRLTAPVSFSAPAYLLELIPAQGGEPVAVASAQGISGPRHLGFLAGGAGAYQLVYGGTLPAEADPAGAAAMAGELKELTPGPELSPAPAGFVPEVIAPLPQRVDWHARAAWRVETGKAAQGDPLRIEFSDEMLERSGAALPEGAHLLSDRHEVPYRRVEIPDAAPLVIAPVSFKPGDGEEDFVMALELTGLHAHLVRGVLAAPASPFRRTVELVYEPDDRPGIEAPAAGGSSVEWLCKGAGPEPCRLEFDPAMPAWAKKVRLVIHNKGNPALPKDLQLEFWRRRYAVECFYPGGELFLAVHDLQRAGPFKAFELVAPGLDRLTPASGTVSGPPVELPGGFDRHSRWLLLSGLAALCLIALYILRRMLPGVPGEPKKI